MEHNEPVQLRAPKQGERLKWFAISHFAISSIGITGMFLSSLLGGYMTTVLFLWEAVLLALYAFAGRWIARKLNWSRLQSTREGVKAFLAPTLIAWIWGGLFLFITAIPGIQSSMGDAGYVVTVLLMWSLLILAFPSSWGFAMLFLACGATESPPILFLLMIIVGAVPPALFLLGSVLGVRKATGEEPKTENEFGPQKSET